MKKPLHAAAVKLTKTISRRDELEHVTQEMYQQNLELAERNKTLSLLRAIDDIVLSPVTDTREVASQIAPTVLHALDFVTVMICVVDKGHLELYGAAGEAADLSHFAQPIRVVNSTQLHHILHSHQGAHFDNWQELLGSARDVQADATAQGTIFVEPMFARQNPIGVLVVRSLQPFDQISQFKANLIERLSSTIGIAIDSKLLTEEIQAASAELRVKNRKLHELDKAKDDFISMASHQLRTPLTTVKGYLSMMLEGDTGKPTAQQKKIMDLAYFSAERMVFLITDLLNVSRMNTGKFVIEPTPVNLAEVVKTEVSQLQRTAEGHNVKLKLDLPKDFPTVMLDENKIRQVMMNFIDNAIYYTPGSGTVTIELESKDGAIEFRVVDTGIGVPERDKKKLFSKFFRADNAKQQRPDGTGLGLFMAKKVVTAQGGSIIFESRVGKGSTFGFRFSLAVLGTPVKQK